ncbi:MAG TPA: hypothetical protein VGG75_25180 [Trebonia sp.]|jgi:hypothetical protein
MDTAAPLAAAGANGPRRVRRAVEVPALADLEGPGAGTLTVPRRLYWTGGDHCGTVDLNDENEVALTYESIIDTAHFTGEFTEYLNAGLLLRVWPTLGVDRSRRRAWESRNPALAARRAVPARTTAA